MWLASPPSGTQSSFLSNFMLSSLSIQESSLVNIQNVYQINVQVNKQIFIICKCAFEGDINFSRIIWKYLFMMRQVHQTHHSCSPGQWPLPHTGSKQNQKKSTDCLTQWAPISNSLPTSSLYYCTQECTLCMLIYHTWHTISNNVCTCTCLLKCVHHQICM